MENILEEEKYKCVKPYIKFKNKTEEYNFKQRIKKTPATKIIKQLYNSIYDIHQEEVDEYKQMWREIEDQKRTIESLNIEVINKNYTIDRYSGKEKGTILDKPLKYY